MHRRRRVVHRRQRQHGHRPGRRARHAAAARVGLRHARQRRHALRAPGRPRGPRRRRPARSKRTIEPRQAGTVEMAPEWRQAIIDGLVGVTTQEGGTAVGAFSGVPQRRVPRRRQDRHRPGERQGARPRCSAPSARRPTPHYAISVFMEESGYGGGGGRAGRPPPVRRALRLRAAARRRPRAAVVPEIAELLARPRGRARLMAAATFATGRRVAPGALGRLSRNPSSPWRHVDLVLVGCVAAVGALGCLMIFSATRGPEPGRLRHELPRRSSCCSWPSASGAMARHRGDRLPPLPGARAVRRTAAIAPAAAPRGLAGSAARRRARRPGSRWARSSCSRRSWPRSW